MLKQSIVFVISFCFSALLLSLPIHAKSNIEARVQKHFNNNYSICFLIKKVGAAETQVFNKNQCQKRFVPAGLGLPVKGLHALSSQSWGHSLSRTSCLTYYGGYAAGISLAAAHSIQVQRPPMAKISKIEHGSRSGWGSRT